MSGNPLKKYNGKKEPITVLDNVIAKYIETIEMMYNSGLAYNEVSVLSDADLVGGSDEVTVTKINKLSYPNLFKNIYEQMSGKIINS